MIGDQADIFGRLKAILPARWFGSPADSMPILDAVLQGIANVLAFAYSLYQYAKLQTRIATATGGYLDLISADFFGTNLLRGTGQSDDSYRALILANLFREKATRNAVVRALTDLTGTVPLVVEPTRPLDTGAYGVSISGYGLAGAYGSLLLPFQAFVTAYRPNSSIGLASIAGYGISTGGYSQASQAEYADSKALLSGVTDTDIFSAVDAVRPAATIIWTRITNKLQGITKVILTGAGAGAWTVPVGVTNLQVELIGGGQSGWIATNNNGGAGADYAKANSLSVTPGDNIAYHIGAGGLATSSSVPNSGGDSWFQNSATVLARGGGSSSVSRGDLIHVGGAIALSGGGGAAGPNAAGNSSASTTGGQGDGAFGGAGGTAATTGNAGTEWGTAGAGGGGGGSALLNGGNGGNYGAGGGGARSGAIAGAGAPGVIVITYLQ